MVSVGLAHASVGQSHQSGAATRLRPATALAPADGPPPEPPPPPRAVRPPLPPEPPPPPPERDLFIPILVGVSFGGYGLIILYDVFFGNGICGLTVDCASSPFSW